MINPKLCEHNFKFATTISKTGMYHPITYLVLFCDKCGYVKFSEVKIK